MVTAAMEQRLRELLQEIERRGKENDERESERPRMMLNLEPASAQLISILVRASGVTRGLEVGTSNAYSTIWLAWSLAPVDGRLISIDRNPDKHMLASENLRRANLLDRVELHTGDAVEIVRQLSGPFDLVFLDADRGMFPEVMQILLPKLAPKALVIADNVLSHAEDIAEYLNLISSLADFQHTIVPVGKGLSIAYRE
ncbi:MAG TPA: class I SAM-dependent methyltransferase [Candidatus Saccharimonadales bacterium]|jgi:predicted O-methyltransferase YrrM|nr:class I SAM-dependent methyltransferase [Candidatus Saccharimonadales bacterium]